MSRGRRWRREPFDGYACWCGFNAQRWITLRTADGGPVRFPVCWAHGDPETWPALLKIEIAVEHGGQLTADEYPGWSLGPVEFGPGPH